MWQVLEDVKTCEDPCQWWLEEWTERVHVVLRSSQEDILRNWTMAEEFMETLEKSLGGEVSGKVRHDEAEFGEVRGEDAVPGGICQQPMLRGGA